MATQNEPASGGMDFWAAIGVAQGTEGEPDETTARSEANGSPAAAPGDNASSETQTTAKQQGQDDWAALFSAWDNSGNGAPPGASQSAEPEAAPSEPEPETAAGAASEAETESETEAETEAESEVGAEPEAASETEPPSEPRTNSSRGSDTVTFKTPKKQGAPSQEQPEQDAEPSPGGSASQAVAATGPSPVTTKTPATVTSSRPDDPLGPDQDWITAEQIANSLRPRLPQIWLEVLTRHTNGDAAMASKVYNVLNGSHLLGELMRDEKVDEVHVHGTQVTVCGPDGIRQIPGFPTVAAARRAIKVVAASREKTGIVVSKVNDYVMISRRNGVGPTADGLIAGGVVTEEQANQIREALVQMRSVTVTGPAARIVVRALASLIPKGSRVFLGAYATLPAGCVTAASPMEADYVLGVRPGAVAEQMAAAGQVGALIANPETPFEAALQFTITGPSAAPDKLVAR